MSASRIIAVVALLLVSVGSIDAKTLFWISPGPALPNVVLADHEGRPIAFDKLVAGRIVAVHFFFTGCTNICPVQTAVLRQTKELIENDTTAGAKPLFVSVSVNPRQDTPTRIRQYAERFDIALGETHDWVMLTGAPEETSKVIAAFDETTRQSPEDHGGAIWIGSPKNGRWARVPVSSPESTSPAALSTLLREAAQ